VNDCMEGALSGFQSSMYSVVAPRELLTVTYRYAASMAFYTDGSLIDKCTGFAFHRTEGGGGFGWYFYCGAYCFVCDTVTYWGGYSTPEIMLDFDRQLEFSEGYVVQRNIASASSAGLQM
jgi:hypothetical protein